VSSFALQRALDLAIARAEVTTTDEEVDCVSSLRLEWATPHSASFSAAHAASPPASFSAAHATPPPACAPSPSSGAASFLAARAAPPPAGAPSPPSVSSSFGADACHRIDAFDGVSLRLPLPPTLAAFLDLTQYRGVTTFALRLKRATLAHRCLCSRLRGLTRAKADISIPTDARHRLSLHAHALGMLLRAVETHALGSDDGWSALQSAVEAATSPAQIQAAHGIILATLQTRCCVTDPGVGAVVGAVLGLSLALERDVAARLGAGPPPPGAGAGTVAAWEAVWRKMIDASRRQLAVLCNALGSSGSSFAPLAATAFPAS